MRRSTGGSGPLELVAVGLFALLVAAVLQRAAHAYGAELYGDEASHYTSGLLIRDYLTHGFPGSPLAYLKAYYGHYPLIGIGHWPPLYYLLEGVWMALFGSARSSILLLSAVVTAGAAVLLYAFAAPRFGRTAALLAALAFVTAPIIQAGDAELMLDTPVALLCLAAMIFYARYLDSGRAAFSAAFGVAAAMALMVKGNAGCLALLPGFAILLGRRFDLLKTPSFWLPVGIVTVTAGPWYVLTYGRVSPGFRYAWGLDYVALANRANLHSLLIIVGPLILALAAAGLISVCLGKARAGGSVAAAALLCSVWVFQAIVPSAIEERYLAPALPPILVLGLAGLEILVDWIIRRWPSRTQRTRGLIHAAALTLAALSFLPEANRMAIKPENGFNEAAKAVWRNRIADNPAVLVAADGSFEDSALAELAMQDPARPSLFVVRGSRLLGGGGYNRHEYQPRFSSATEAMEAVDRYAIPLVLFSSKGGKGEWAHLHQLAEARGLDPERWEILYQDRRHNPPITLFRLRGNDTRKSDAHSLLALSAPRGLE